MSIVTAVVLLGAGPARAQDNTEGSLAALTEEVRQLRLAIEESTRVQSQMAAMSVYISAQHARWAELIERLEDLVQP